MGRKVSRKPIPRVKPSEIGPNGGKYRAAFIPLAWIQLPPQVRQTFVLEEIVTLAESIIGTGGCVNAPCVWRFDHKGFARYLAIVNELWREDCSISDFRGFKEDGITYYYPVVAGGRRTRAYRLIWDEGCQTCREQFGKEKPGKCFKRHFGGDNVKVQLVEDGDPVTALNDMFSENNYVPPPIHEDARGVARYYEFVKANVDPDITMRHFAKHYIGRSPEKVSDARRFWGLPSFFQKAVQDGTIPFGVAIQLGRLLDAGIPEKEVERNWYVQTIVCQWSVDQLRKAVAKHLGRQALGEGQKDLSDLMRDAQAKEAMRLRYKKVILQKLLPGIHQTLAYHSKILRLFAEGLLGSDDSHFSEQSFRTIYEKLLRQVRDEVLPHLRHLTAAEKQEQAAVFTEGIQLLRAVKPR